MTRPGNPAPTTGPGTETPRGTTSPTGRGDCRRKSRFGADCQSGIALGIPGGFAAYTAGTVDGNSAPAPSSPWGVCTGPSQQKQNKIRDFSVAAFKSAGLPRRGVPRAAVRRGSRRNTSLAHLYCAFGIPLLWRRYHQILRPRRHLPKVRPPSAQILRDFCLPRLASYLAIRQERCGVRQCCWRYIA